MNKQDKLKQLYIAVNEMMAVIGAEGEIDSRHNYVDNVMDALHDLDDGVYDIGRVFDE